MVDPNGSSDEDPGSRHDRGRRQSLAYQGAFEAVASIMIGGGLGYFADRYFDSDPYLLLVGFALGFGAFFVRLDRLRRTLEAQPDEDREQPPDA